MLLATKSIEELNELLDNKLSSDIIKDYRIYLMLDTTIGIDVVLNEENEENEELLKELENISLVKIDYEQISLNDYENDSFYEHKFSSDNKIDLGYKRRLSNLDNTKSTNDEFSKIPIVSFYSYKGGVGRTTSLVSFANYLSYTKGKKVLMIDFDLEAPGLSNFFGSSMNNLDKNGLVEYVLDKQSSKEDNLGIVENYLVEVPRKYTNDGSIYIMSAGNLSNSENVKSYLEGLARIDITGNNNMLDQLKGLIEDIDKAIEPDIILIDSRTGFNDIFGILLNKLSKIVVGIFEENKQTNVGLEMFIDKCLINDKNIAKPFFLNSQINKQDEHETRLKDFQDTIDEYLSDDYKDINDNSIVVFPLKNNRVLSNLGTLKENDDEYLEFIKDMPKDYQKYCKSLYELTFDDTVLKVNTTLDHPTKTVDKSSILHTLLSNFPEPYGENIKDFDDDFFNKKFFFRKCFEDIFNYDKMLIIGSKGTGKTTLYNSLKNDDFLKTLKTKAGRSNNRIKAINIISSHDGNDPNNPKYIEINNIFDDDMKEEDYKKFWLIFITNSILLDLKSDGYTKQIDSLPQEFVPSKATVLKKLFLSFVSDDEQFIKIENELTNINKWLKQKETTLMIAFDQLDFVVKPDMWNKAIVPLINYFKSNPYDKIHPKLFLRSDLFNKLSNITNKQSLESRSIYLNWSKEEIFGFLFKTIFAFAKEDFLDFMEQNDSYKDSAMEIKKYLKKEKVFNQVKLEAYYLEPLVEVFFGKSADMNSSASRVHGKPYDWFYKNLSNANNTISLRPFLDLIKYAIEKSINDDDVNKLPLLGASYYAEYGARKQCVQRYFDDLSDEKGNELFKNIISIIKENDFPNELRNRESRGFKYEKFMKNIVDSINKDRTEKIIKEDIENSLIHNEVINIEYRGRSGKKLTFAYLYKYFLGLRG